MAASGRCPQTSSSLRSSPASTSAPDLPARSRCPVLRNNAYHGAALRHPIVFGQCRMCGKGKGSRSLQGRLISGHDAKPVLAVASEAAEKMTHGDLDDETLAQHMSLGSWRVRSLMHAPFEGLGAQLESAWRQYLPMTDLGLGHLPEEFRFCDTADPERDQGMWAYKELPDPERGQAGWPRLRLENRCYESRVFRKMHLELAARQDGLQMLRTQVLHCVLYPRVEYDLPILSMDMVGKDGAISLCIVDACPVSANRSLPQLYTQLVRQLQTQYGVESNREAPDWGHAIFSDHCVLMRPQTSEQLAGFLKYAVALHRAHLVMARNLRPVETDRARRVREITEAHKLYCKKQLENRATRAVLDAAFGADFGARYMREVMFDE